MRLRGCRQNLTERCVPLSSLLDVSLNVARGVPFNVTSNVAWNVPLDLPLDVRSLVPLGVETPTTIPKAERRLQFPDDADGGGLSTTPQSGRIADPQHTRMKDVSIRSGRHPKLAPPNSAACWCSVQSIP